ncbi:hypothetical protein D1B31_17760 [Neobacillus notoginsengisoli]|uniref:Large polyvalent protein-associated domain-containing protein n=2 Tax=Neobacillus notoginsengisoli TaxID=1578198 RepID=A0A417YQ11_9BACI|nr:hypothetical protein D1B31_17760 [Neobacillus notoginsengisoli]
MDTSQLSLFQVASEENEELDIRTEQQASNKIAYDVGEKIGGARKDMAALRKAFEENNSASLLEEIESFSSALAVEVVTKNNLFKGFSLEQERENEVEPAVARAKQLLIQRIDASPADDSKDGRLKFMKAAQHLLALMEPVKTLDEFYTLINEIAGLLRNERTNLAYYENTFETLKTELGCLEKGSEEWKQKYNKALWTKKTLNDTKKAQEIGLRSLGEKFINFFRNKASYTSTLTNALKVTTWEELLSKKKKKQPSTRKPVWERNLPDRPDRIGGAQSPIEKPEDLVMFFDFRGVEFGHYMGDEKGMEHLLRSSEAMMDLAELLGVDYKAVSLGGTLAMAYGARGRGGSALAHFEPISNVINMTKEKGCLGVLGHEWFHALDSRLYNLSHNSKNGKRGFASEPDTLGNHIDSFLQLLFAELIDVIKSGNSIGYYENTNKPGERWRGTQFKMVYKRHGGDLFKAMEEKVKDASANLESQIRYYSSLSYVTEKDIEKLKKKTERDIKSFAQAIAWYHEEQTGERVERIPYPSNMSNYYQAAIALDKNKVGRYWSANLELSARAFESFIQDKLKAAGRRSDYLVAGTRDGLAFPMDEEREAINKKFEQIFEFIKEENLL